MNSQYETLFYASIALLAFALVLLVIRKLVTWYFKIDRRIELMEKMCNQNVKIIEELRTLNSGEPCRPDEQQAA